jgi:transposase
MIWGAFVNDIIFDLYFIEAIYDAERYCNMLEECFDPFMRPDCAFMPDDASIHRAKYTKKWLEVRNKPIIEWPPNSPDLNPIENLCGILVKLIYSNSRKFSSKEEL